MTYASFHMPAPDGVIAVAVHNGHDLRPDLADLVAIDDSTRLREEDPETGSVATRFGASVVVHRSRFEVDLNRERHHAVYLGPDEAWGLNLWSRPLTETQVAISLGVYDRFYVELAEVLDSFVSEQGGFVLYDIHSYNHRRGGPLAEPDPPAEAPTVNLGTGSLPERWKGVADVFIETMRERSLDGVALDVRENVRFNGRQLARWVHDNYGDTSCALAIEMKKVFMDEWTGAVDQDRLRQLGDALIGSTDPVRRAWARA
jgi:N-formylglutamate amidohydrolase